jgi:hypothetical protein
MLFPERQILTVKYETMMRVIDTRKEQLRCSLEEAYRAELMDVGKWLRLAQNPQGVYIIGIAADE